MGSIVGALSAALASPGHAAPIKPRFEPRIPSHPLETAEQTWISMTGDLNGDGIPDRLARGSGDWFVFFGAPDGSFRPGPATPAVEGLTAVADIDRDGLADLITGSQEWSGGASIAVARGRGDGTFLQPVTGSFAVGAVVAVEVVDIAPDGIADLRVTIERMECSDWECWPVPETYLLAGDGTGAFAAVSGILPYDFNRALFTDVNGDGRVDVVGDGSSLPVYLGDGAGGFAAPVWSTNVLSSALAAGDVNGDGHVDLVGTAFQRATSVLGNGDGTFRRGFEFGPRIEKAQLTDWNQDGVLDLVVPEAGLLSVWRGDGAGTFHRVASYGLAGLPYQDPYFLHADADGRLDLVFGTQDRAFVIQATPDDAFGRSLLAATATAASGVAVFDADGDGSNDLVVGSGASESLLYPGDGKGDFGPPQVLPVPAGATELVAQDMDRDGAIDLVSVHEKTQLFSIAYGLAGGGFAAPLTFAAGGAASRLRLGDVDGDGRTDVVTIPDFYDFFASSRFQVILASGPRSFGSPLSYTATGYVRDARFLGRDGAGRPTFAVLTWSPAAGGEFVLYRPGTAGLVPTAPRPVPAAARTVAAGDVNGDGSTDLLVGSTTLEILYGTPSGDFTAGPALPAAPGVERITLADLDRDGKLDIVAALADQNVRLWTASEAGGFDAPSDWGVLTRADDLTAGDVNGDGRPDLFVLNTRCGIVNLLASVDKPTPVLEFFLQASAAGVVVSWSLGMEDLGTLRRIEVLRSTRADGPFAAVASFEALSDQMQYLDREARPGTEVWYGLALYDQHGNMSLVAARSLRLSNASTALHGPRTGAAGAIVFPYDVGGAGANVEMSLFDVRGRLVVALDQGWRDAGHHEVAWSPRHAARGVYFLRFRAGDFVAHRRVLTLQE